MNRAGIKEKSNRWLKVKPAPTPTQDKELPQNSKTLGFRSIEKNPLDDLIANLCLDNSSLKFSFRVPLKDFINEFPRNSDAIVRDASNITLLKPHGPLTLFNNLKAHSITYGTKEFLNLKTRNSRTHKLISYRATEYTR